MSRAPIEVMEPPCSEELCERFLEDLDPVSFVPTASRDRQECMQEAAFMLLGDHELAARLQRVSGKPYLLLIFRISDVLCTTAFDFAHIFLRYVEAARREVGPRVYDGWLCHCDAGSLGFIRMERPHLTIAEYLAPTDEDDHAVLQDVNELSQRVMVTAPLARSLLVQISNSEIGCWPQAVLAPSGVALFTDANGLPNRAVVLDWTLCARGTPSSQQLLSGFLRNYKQFLDAIPVEKEGDAGHSFFKERFEQATNQRTPEEVREMLGFH